MEGPPPTYKQVIDSDFIHAGGNSVYRNTTIPVNQYNTNNLFNRIRIEKEKYYFLKDFTNYNLLPVSVKADIRLYAKHLGVDLNKHPYLIKYVISCILEELPGGWQEHLDKDGNVFYQNNILRETTWLHPMEQFYKDLIYTKINIKKSNKCWFW